MEVPAIKYDPAQQQRVWRELDQHDDIATSTLMLAQRNAAPAKYAAGMVVYADGTNWDPGSGEGVYCYYNSTWNYLG